MTNAPRIAGGSYLVGVQQADGHFAQNYETNGRPHWTSIQLDETALPLVLTWQLHRTDPTSMAAVRKAARFLLTFRQDGFRAPWSEQERWENQSGYSPGTIASVIADQVCAADLQQQVGNRAAAHRYLEVADRWTARVDGWTATSTGPFSPAPYYLRLSKTGGPDAGTLTTPVTTTRARSTSGPRSTPASSSWSGSASSRSTTQRC